jgi:FixJ family two-component response regulator
MPGERSVHIVDDEAKVRDALTLLLSTAQIDSRLKNILHRIS